MTRNLRAADILLFASVAAVAYGAKRWAASADATDLRFVLGPTCFVAERITGATFIDEGSAGYLNRELAIAVVPACSGMNFMILAFCMLSSSFALAFAKARAKLGWIVLSAGAAYAGTVLVNAIRIAVTVELRREPVELFALSSSELHRALGVLVYLSCLFGLHALAQRTIRSFAS